MADHRVLDDMAHEAKLAQEQTGSLMPGVTIVTPAQKADIDATAKDVATLIYSGAIRARIDRVWEAHVAALRTARLIP